ncbi:MAG: TM2 domain-containing protein [Flavobacteriales bacterium]|nr:TM2 domain-containing protein [Flavobacteriales bacterium]
MSNHYRFYAYYPKITSEEVAFMELYMPRLTEEQAKEFIALYNESRLDPQTYMLLAALGFIFTSGTQRFYIGEWGVGILYMFTCGLFGIGTIYDLATGKERVLNLNHEKAKRIFANYGTP